MPIGERVFVIRPQSQTASRENALGYDDAASGQTIYAYVSGSPLNFVDPFGLDQFGIGIEAPSGAATLGGALNPIVDTGHTFAYIVDDNGQVTNIVSVGPSSPIGARNLSDFLNGRLPAVSNWPIQGKIDTYQWKLPDNSVQACKDAFVAKKKKPGSYSPTNQCTSAAIGLAQQCGVRVPNGISPVIGQGNLPNPYGLLNQLNRTNTPAIAPASRFGGTP